MATLTTPKTEQINIYGDAIHLTGAAIGYQG